MSDPNTLDLGFTSARPALGRPPNIVGIREERRTPVSTPTTKNGAGKARVTPASPTRTLIRTPLFNLKHGPSKVGRLAPNSLFSKSLAPQLQELKQNRKLAQGNELDTTTLQHFLSSATHVPPAQVTDAIVAEDVLIHSTDLGRWVNPDYPMRVEEATTFVDILNNVSESIGANILFVEELRIVPRVLRALDWSRADANIWVCCAFPSGRYLAHALSPLLQDDIDQKNPLLRSQYLQALHLHHQQRPYQGLASLKLDGYHWSISVHDLSGNTDNVVVINSLTGNLSGDLQQSILLARFLRPDRHAHPVCTSRFSSIIWILTTHI